MLYPAFVATIRGEYYGTITQDMLDEECYNLACRAIAAFKFPKVSLAYDTFYAIRDTETNTLREVDPTCHPEAIPHAAFYDDAISYAEFEVIIAWMKFYWAENQLSNADNFEDIYTDANIKTYSRANAVDKATTLYKTYKDMAREAENRYSRINWVRRPALGDVNLTEDEYDTKYGAVKETILRHRR